MPVRFFRCSGYRFLALLLRLVRFNLELEDLQYAITGRTLKARFDELKGSPELPTASKTLCLSHPFRTFPRGQYRFPRLPQRLCIRELFQALFKSEQRLLKAAFLGLSVGLVLNLNDPLLLSARFRNGKQIVDLTLPSVLRCQLPKDLCGKNRLTSVQQFLRVLDRIPHCL